MSKRVIISSTHLLSWKFKGFIHHEPYKKSCGFLDFFSPKKTSLEKKHPQKQMQIKRMKNSWTSPITKHPLNSITLLAIDKNLPVSTIQSHNINILQGSKVVELLRKALKISKPRPMGRMVKLPGTNWVRPRRCWGGGLGIGQGLDTSVV